MSQPVDSPLSDSQLSKPWWRRLWEPCDIASVAFFRVAFAGVMLWHVVLFLTRDWVQFYFGDSPHHLSYFGFEWVRPLSGGGMKMVFYLMGLAAIGVGVGLFYRLSAIVLFVTYTYTFLAEAGLFQNHYYMMSLVAFLLILIPAHRSFSVDALAVPERKSAFIPNWCRWVLMFVVALPYVYGGIAKLNGDWLHGMPVGFWISYKSDLPLIGPYLTERWMAWVLSYAGLVLDLVVVPALLWKRTRMFAYIAATIFHLMNALLFDIDVFPWMMILATTIFFPADWPRKLLRLASPSQESLPPENPTISQRAVLGVVALFVVWQLVFPLRHWAYPGNPSWTEEGHQFAWRMMLRNKDVFLRFYATDRDTGRVVDIPVERMLNPLQLRELAVSPDQIVAISRWFAEIARKDGMNEVEIRAVVIASLNGRKPQLLIDPDLDLLTVERTWGHQHWIRPLTEPLRAEPWDLPTEKWPDELGIELPQATRPGAPPRDGNPD